MIIDPNAPQAIEQIVARLRSGNAVAIPTETVYGLAADAANPAAVEKIFLLKQRPLDHPLIVHLADLQQLSLWTRDVPPVAYQLAEAFWPGPLTLILPKARQVQSIVTAGQDTVGIRIPAHPVALAILRAFGGGLAAPSANPFTSLSPTTAQHVAEYFTAELWVVEGGPTEVGLESTIIDCSGAQPIILRAGMITSECIKRKTGLEIFCAEQTQVKHKVHYAPNTRLRLFDSHALTQALAEPTSKQQLGLLSYQQRKPSSDFKKSICLSDDPRQYAQKFYAALHELDRAAWSEMWVELPPQEEVWQAIHTRLIKAVAKFAN